MSMLIKVAAVQSRLGQYLTLEERLHVFKQRPDFVCLPEYCLIDDTQTDFARAALLIKDNLEYLSHLSREWDTCLIAGSVAEADSEAIYNSAYIFQRGDLVGRYRKLSPVAGEINRGILPGDRIFIKEIEDIRIAVLICADALNPGLFDVLAKNEIDLIFIPTTSPLRPAERQAEKHKRDCDIYLAGSRKASAYIVKACGVGSLFGKPLQGRSLIVSPWDIMRRVPIYAEDQPAVLTATLDIEELRDFRSKQKKISRMADINES